MDAFSNCGVSLECALNLDMPFFDDLFKARLDYLQEKQKIQEAQYKRQSAGT